MIEQQAMLKLLTEDPIIESASWIVGEPGVQDLMNDPLIHAVLSRDGLNLQDLRVAIAVGRGRLAAAGALSKNAAPTSDAA